jgi:hypothetical protein
MKIDEIILENNFKSLRIKDSYGGEIIIRPDPTVHSSPEKFSLSYINKQIAKHFKVQDRILGLDSHGHLGIPEPHLHGFSANKYRGYYRLNKEILNYSFESLVQVFYELYAEVINRYEREK